MNFALRILRAFAVLLALVASSTAPVSAQSVAKLVVVEALPGAELVAVLSREASDGGADQVVIRRDAITPELLRTVLDALMASRRRHGARATRAIRVEYTAATRLAPLTDIDRRRMRAIIDAVLSEPVRRIPGVGTGRSKAIIAEERVAERN